MTEKVYLENPYLRQLEARITDKEYVNDKYYIKLNKTIFYPNLAGGQPGDRGTMNGIEVIDSYEEDENIIHVTRENIHSDRVSLSIDWDNRLDYMQQHSGQHLLSSVFYKLFNAETKGFYIGRDHVYIDINLPYLKKSGLEKVEQFTNKVIFSNFPIKSYLVKKEYPDNYSSDGNKGKDYSNRIVEIDGFDFTPCCGTHLRNTGEIGIIKIKKWEEFEGGVRVFFLCGTRALKDYAMCNDYIYSIENKLGCNFEQSLEKIHKIRKENVNLRSKVLDLQVKSILDSGENYKGLVFIHKKIEELNITDMQDIAMKIIDKNNQVIFLFNGQDFIFGLSRNLTSYIEDDFPNSNFSDNIHAGSCKINEAEAIMQNFFQTIIKKL